MIFYKSRHYIVDMDQFCRPDILFETIAQLITHWWKIKNMLNRILDNLLFKIFFSSVFAWTQKLKYKTKVFFIE